MHAPLALLVTASLSSPSFQEATLRESEDPPRPSGLVALTDAAAPGYTLFTPLRSRVTYVVDMRGEVVHTWESEYPPGNSIYLQDNGDLIRCGRVQHPVFHAGGQGGRIQRFSWDGELLWDYDSATEEHLTHHDIAVLPSGNILALAYELRTGDAAIAVGRDPEAVGDEGFWPDVILELKPTGRDGAEIVWQWSSWDHLVQDFDPHAENFGSVAERPERIDINGDHRDDRPLTQAEVERQAEVEAQMRALGYVDESLESDSASDEPEKDGDDGNRRRRAGDWLHSNSIHYHPELDLIALSVHAFSEVWILDHSTTTAEASGTSGGRYGRGGDLLARFGNPRLSGAGDDDDRRLFRQHDARFVDSPNEGELRVLVFNNGEGRPDESYSSVDEFALSFDSKRGFADGRPELVWTYTAPEPTDLAAPFISGSQRLWNGNTLVCDGPLGRLFEVTPNGEIAWDYWNPFGGEEPLVFSAGKPKGDDEHADPTDPAVLKENPEGSAAADEPPPRRGPMIPKGLFRGTRLPADHPGLSRLREDD